MLLAPKQGIHSQGDAHSYWIHERPYKCHRHSSWKSISDGYCLKTTGPANRKLFVSIIRSASFFQANESGKMMLCLLHCIYIRCSGFQEIDYNHQVVHHPAARIRHQTQHQLWWTAHKRVLSVNFRSRALTGFNILVIIRHVNSTQ